MVQTFAETIAAEQKRIVKCLDEFYKEIGNRPVYTKELIKYNAEQVAKLTVDNWTIPLMGMHGKVHHDCVILAQCFADP